MSSTQGTYDAPSSSASGSGTAAPSNTTSASAAASQQGVADSIAASLSTVYGVPIQAPIVTGSTNAQAQPAGPPSPADSAVDVTDGQGTH